MYISSRFACIMTYSLYRLNKYRESTHPCLTPFPIEKLSVSPYSVRTFASSFAYNDLITCILMFWHTHFFHCIPWRWVVNAVKCASCCRSGVWRKEEVNVAQPNVVASVWFYLGIYHLSGLNTMRYKYYTICFGICMQSLWRFRCKLCKHSLGNLTVHEPKWTSQEKRGNQWLGPGADPRESQGSEDPAKGSESGSQTPRGIIIIVSFTSETIDRVKCDGRGLERNGSYNHRECSKAIPTLFESPS